MVQVRTMGYPQSVSSWSDIESLARECANQKRIFRNLCCCCSYLLSNDDNDDIIY